MPRRKLYTPPTDTEIACFAFSILQNENPQRATEVWLQAKAHLIAVRQHDAGMFDSTIFKKRNRSLLKGAKC